MDLLRKIYYRLSPEQRRLARRVFFLPADLYDLFLNKRPPLVPPKGRIFTGQGDYIAIGNTFLDNFIKTCRLKPHHHLLDVGCGIGRVARPLTYFLNAEGRYDGFDIVKDGIAWCSKHYRDDPRFRFLHIPLKNDLYNLSSNLPADTFQFPYNNRSFDLVILTSVFTHMQTEEVNNYLQEIYRVLKPDAYCFATFFLLTEASEQFLNQSEKPFFPYRFENYFLHNAHVKNANIAYRYQFIEKMVEAASLEIDQFYPGWWAGLSPDNTMNFQDVLVLKKPDIA